MHVCTVGGSWNSQRDMQLVDLNQVSSCSYVGNSADHHTVFCGDNINITGHHILIFSFRFNDGWHYPNEELYTGSWFAQQLFALLQPRSLSPSVSACVNRFFSLCRLNQNKIMCGGKNCCSLSPRKVNSRLNSWIKSIPNGHEQISCTLVDSSWHWQSSLCP